MGYDSMCWHVRHLITGFTMLDGNVWVQYPSVTNPEGACTTITLAV